METIEVNKKAFLEMKIFNLEKEAIKIKKEIDNKKSKLKKITEEINEIKNENSDIFKRRGRKRIN